MTDGLHHRAEERSLALHAAVAERLLSDPALVDRAVERVRGWLAEPGVVPAPLAAAWLEALSGPREVLFALLVDRSERARQLRQCSPFAGVLDARTRWRILREAKGAVVP
ncbi:MAG: hypothetical protein KJ067_07105 [Vicinamibacteria bacterium]|nr:hypothetical protein [Vicinamibacteria bacterium]